jgi:hypothetical protein
LVETIRGKEGRAPRIVSVLSLTEDGDPHKFVDDLGAEEKGGIWRVQ